VATLAVILSILSLIIWIALVFFRGAFWLLRPFDDDHQAHNDLQTWPRVVAIVPARNEAATIGRTVESLVRQDYRGDFQIIVVNDLSTDETERLALLAAEVAGAANRVSIISSLALPPGWTGKLWAMQQGVQKAASFDHVAPGKEEISQNYLWFTDADIQHKPDTLTRLVSRAATQNLQLTSLMVLLQAKTFPERLLIPSFLYFFLKLFPPRWIADARAHTAGAAGGCILLRGNALQNLGGLAAIRTEVIDDCALARAVKRSGGRIWMGLTRKSVSLRSYESFAEISDLIARTAFTQLGYSRLLLLGTWLGMFITYLVPVGLLFSARPMVWRVSLAAWALMSLSYLPTVRFYRLSPLWAVALPISAAFYSYATWLSALRFWLGRGGQWKGRAQAHNNSAVS
jgi:hopene-associated glycosyltransferase HpnB